MNNIISILENYKGKTVDEVINILNQCEKERNDKETERKNNYNEFLKSREGKYFVINFNGASFIVLYVDHIDVYKYSTKLSVIDIYRGEYFNIKFESRDINHIWFLNPYKTYNYGGPGVKECKEITKEEYDNIEKECLDIINKMKSFNL